MAIEAVSIFVVIDGQVCIAPLSEEGRNNFASVLPSLQLGCGSDARLVALPDDIAQQVRGIGQMLERHASGATVQ